MHNKLVLTLEKVSTDVSSKPGTFKGKGLRDLCMINTKYGPITGSAFQNEVLQQASLIELTFQA